MGNGFIQFIRGDESFELIRRSHHAFILLAVIAQRARRTPNIINNLEVGEAMLGDFENYGMTKQEYRTAKQILEKCDLVTLIPTPKGTIAKIINTSIFDINIIGNNTQANMQPTHEQHTANTQLTPNKNVKNVKKKKNDNTIVYSDGFLRFYLAYPKKACKQLAFNSWGKLDPGDELVETIINAVEKQCETGIIDTRDLQYCPLPVTWLNQRRWEDGIETNHQHKWNFTGHFYECTIKGCSEKTYIKPPDYKENT